MISTVVPKVCEREVHTVVDGCRMHMVAQGCGIRRPRVTVVFELGFSGVC